MKKAKYTLCMLIATALILVLSLPSLATPATVKKTVETLGEGNYIITFVVTATSSDIFAFSFTDPKGAVTDVYAADGWCFLTDGEQNMASTWDNPISAKKSLKFVVHATSAEAEFVWTFFGPMEQIGKSEVV